MSSEFGHRLKISIFGQSHGNAIGVLIDGLPAGIEIDMEALSAFLARRAPGRSSLTTSRKEADLPEFISGLTGSKTCGSPLCAIIKNTDARSGDYEKLVDLPRPSHADYTAFIKYSGAADMRGGGHFSGRLTAPLCIAGGIALQLLERKNIYVGAHISSAAGVTDLRFDPVNLSPQELKAPGKKPLPVIDDSAGEKMLVAIEEASSNLDSAGGTIECFALGLPVGLGEPMFDGVESRLASVLFGIPAVKGIEFGAGFAAADMHGSQHNDPFRILDGRVVTETNNAGGILGGITSGMPLSLRVAVKPTPSISRPQKTVSLSKMENSELVISGRHDPCIVLRAVPCIEAATAAVLLDMLLEENMF